MQPGYTGYCTSCRSQLPAVQQELRRCEPPVLRSAGDAATPELGTPALRWGLMAVGMVGEEVGGHTGGARSTQALAAGAGSGGTAPTHPSQGALVHKEEMIHGHQAAPEQIFHCYGMFPEHECDN